MHEFLDNAGIFQVNIKAQLDEEKKSTYSASPILLRLSQGRSKKSPSLIERRRKMFSSKSSNAGGASGGNSSTGVKSQRAQIPRLNLQLGRATFSTEIFEAVSFTMSSKVQNSQENLIED